MLFLNAPTQSTPRTNSTQRAGQLVLQATIACVHSGFHAGSGRPAGSQNPSEAPGALRLTPGGFPHVRAAPGRSGLELDVVADFGELGVNAARKAVQAG